MLHAVRQRFPASGNRWRTAARDRRSALDARLSSCIYPRRRDAMAASSPLEWQPHRFSSVDLRLHRRRALLDRRLRRCVIWPEIAEWRTWHGFLKLWSSTAATRSRSAIRRRHEHVTVFIILWKDVIVKNFKICRRNKVVRNSDYFILKDEDELTSCPID